MKMECSAEKAREIIAAFGSLQNKTKSIIHTNKIGAIQNSFTNLELENIIKKYLYKMLSLVNKYISQKKLISLPIIFSGKLSGVSGLDKYLSSISNCPISIYSPISFIERNEENIESIGVINYNEVMDNILGKQLDTIIHTNPHSMKSLKSNRDRDVKWYVRIKEKILGGKNDWN